jgi:hypothetical protein
MKPMEENKDVLDDVGTVLDGAADVGRAIPDARVQAGVVIYDVAKKTGMIAALGNILRRAWGFIKSNN